jgi:hypothetical protein
MTDLNKVHEKETFTLKSSASLSWAAVEPAMTCLGFTLTDDFAELLRIDDPLPWQSETLVTCTFLSHGKEVYPDETGFDCLECSILVATLPEEHIATAIQAIHQLADEFSLSVLYHGKAIARPESSKLLKIWLSDILAESGDKAGSESVRIVIEMEYQKKRH